MNRFMFFAGGLAVGVVGMIVYALAWDDHHQMLYREQMNHESWLND